MSTTSVGILSQPSAATAAIRAAMELVVSSGVGVASIQGGYLTTATIKALSQTTFSILLPLFLGTSIANTVTKYGLETSSLAVPTLAVLQSFLLYAITTQILFPLILSDDESNSDDANGTAICASFGNGGVLPLIFCDSLFRTNPDQAGLSTGYVSLFLVGWSPFFWSFGRSVLLKQTNTAITDQKRATKTTTSTVPAIVKLVPPPVQGVVVGMVVATIPILRNLFVVGKTPVSVAPLRCVFDTAQNFGKAASPLSLLVLVSSLALGAGFGAKEPPSTAPTNHTSTNIPLWKKWGIVSVSRFLVSPMLMLGLLRGMSRTGIIGDKKDQPMLWFVCLLESCMPPAQNQVTMLHVENKVQQGNEMAAFLFLVYATSMLPVTLLVSLALDLLGLMAN